MAGASPVAPAGVSASYETAGIPTISAAVSSIARQLTAAAILPLTKSGATAHNVSKFRPPTPILAITSEANVARRLQLAWGVTPLLIPDQEYPSAFFHSLEASIF